MGDKKKKKDEKTINQKVVLWARGKRGQQVGKRGECWDLADQALTSAGAQSSTTTGEKDDYVWGDAIDLNDVQPGDILQFRDHSVLTTTKTRTEFTNGDWQEKTETQPHNRGHHTAIVDALHGNEVTVLEQHVLPLGKKVQRHNIPLGSGAPTTTIKQTRAKDGSGKLREAKVTTTVTVQISGEIKAYRPKPK